MEEMRVNGGFKHFQIILQSVTVHVNFPFHISEKVNWNWVQSLQTKRGILRSILKPV